LLTTIKTEDDPVYGTSGGNDTEDKIFLLSKQEVEKYFPNQFDRTAAYNGSIDAGTWWLRTPRRADEYQVFGNVYGGATNMTGTIGSTNQKNPNGVRPAMWIKLS